MAVTKDDILEAVGNMSVMDLNDLVKAFEEKFGVSAASMAVAAPGAGGGAGAAAAEQTEFTVVLAETGANKVA
jgi:large subunit ribosomal protein L7/L12